MTRDEFISSLRSIDKAPFLFWGSGFSRHYIDTPTWEGVLGKFSNKPINQYRSILNTDSLPLIATELSKDLTNDFWNSPKDNMDSSIQVVYGFGAIDKYMTANGYIGLSAMDIMRDVLKEEEFYDAEKILTKSLLTITKRTPTIYIPIYKYLSNVGIHSDEEYKTNPLNLHYELRKGTEFQAYKCVSDEDKKMTLQEAISTYTGKDTWRAVVLIPYLNIQEEDLPLLASFIEENMAEILKSNHSSYMRKLICFYDWKKYGWE